MMYVMSSGYSSERIKFNHHRFEDIETREVSMHVHDAFEIIFLKEGNLSYIIDSKIYTVRNNSIIITRPGNPHSIHLKSSTYERFVIIFDHTIIFPEIYNALPDETDVIFLANPTPVIEILKKLDFFCKNFQGDALSNIICNVIEELFYHIIVIADTHSGEVSLNEYPSCQILKKAVEYIDLNLAHKINLDMLCRELYISKSYLNKLFNQHLHTPPVRYITSKRLILAQRLLREKNKPQKIFSECGFSDYSSFYRCYVQYFGYPPSMEPKKKTPLISY